MDTSVLIEKSTSEFADFKIIGKIASNNGGRNKYHYVDRDPQDGTQYFRIRQIDLDGRFTYSETVLFNRRMQQTNTIYPNPAAITTPPKPGCILFSARFYDALAKKAAGVYQRLTLIHYAFLNTNNR